MKGTVQVAGFVLDRVKSKTMINDMLFPVFRFMLKCQLYISNVYNECQTYERK